MAFIVLKCDAWAYKRDVSIWSLSGEAFKTGEADLTGKDYAYAGTTTPAAAPASGKELLSS